MSGQHHGLSVLREMVAAGSAQVEGVAVIIDAGAQIRPGDWYLGAFNTGPQLLTCRQVHPHGYVVSQESAYPYDTAGCVRVTVPELEER